MAPKKKPLKLNKLQLRTLVLAQVLCADSSVSRRDEEAGEVTLLRLPHAHGDHFHIGKFAVSAREASGLHNPAVWNALARKGLVRLDSPMEITITAPGLDYDTGLSERFLAPSDH